PPGSGGLLPALHLWRRLAMVGADLFGEVFYLGTVPMAGRQGLVDAVVGRHGGAECRFLFDPDDGLLLALEMFPDENVDPCEVYFHDYRPVEDRWLPGQIEVRVGDERYATFQIEAFDFQEEG
ncbi:MAG: hypothetical protein ACYTG0_19625, partial [Planctomycetota bacterium]